MDTKAAKRLWSLPKHSAQPLYQQIQACIMDHLQAGRLKAGDALPSYPWLSKTLGVADKTVRQAYAELHRLGVLEIHKGKGTFVAGGPGHENRPRGIHTGVIGLLPPRLPLERSDEAACWNVLRAVQEAVLAESLDALMLNRGNELTAPGQVERLADLRRVDGLVLVAPPQSDFVARVRSLRMPVIAADAPEGSSGIDAVSFDYAGAGSERTLRLIGLGHHRIGLVRMPRGHAAAEIEAGYRHAMGTAGLPVRPAWVLNVDTDLGETGASSIDTLLEEGLTALLVCSASLAQTAMDCGARRHLSVPRHLSITGVVSAGAWPLPGGLTLDAAGFDTTELGQRVVRRLLEQIKGREEPPHRDIVKARLLDGTSVAAVAGPE